jgi:hypothetical protein
MFNRKGEFLNDVEIDILEFLIGGLQLFPR